MTIESIEPPGKDAGSVLTPDMMHQFIDDTYGDIPMHAETMRRFCFGKDWKEKYPHDPIDPNHPRFKR